MDFGVGYFPAHDGMSPGALAQLLEESGQDAVFFAEHTHIPAGASALRGGPGRPAGDRGGDGRPHVVPMTFALASDKTRPTDTIYTAVDAKPKRSTSLRRLANIAANPRVAVIVDHYEVDWRTLWWVRADGTARLLTTDEPESRDAIERLIARYPQYRDQSPRSPVVAIDVIRWSSWSGSGD